MDSEVDDLAEFVESYPTRIAALLERGTEFSPPYKQSYPACIAALSQ